MKNKLKKMLEQRTAKKVAIEKRAKECDNIEELRGLNASLEEINDEISEIRTALEELDKEPTQSERTAAVNSEIPGVVVSSMNSKKNDEARGDKYASMEYREAFMNFCKTGAPMENRLDAFTDTVEAAAQIPTTIMNEIVKKMTAYGSLFSRIRKLNIKGGVNVPIVSLKPTASWITEATTSDRLKITASGSVSFSYFGLECKVASSLLVNEVSIDSFESTLIELIVEAMAKAADISIMKGVGTTEPLGIAVDPRVPAGQVITLSAADFVTYEGWKKKVFAKIPLAYRAGGTFVMAAGTFEGYIDGMTDTNGQPVGRINYGIADGTQERFAGKEVLLVEDDVVAAYDAANVGDVVAVFCKLSDYGFNSNMQMTMYRWLDHDKNQWVDKALLIADGKLIDPNGVVVVKKGA